MTQINKVPIDQIEPDKNQPRQKFYDEEIAELAQNIKSEGIINPIEIDENNVIITGERRWRAAKMAGLTVVPCFVNSLSGKERYKHQLSENIHQNTMNDLDTAAALDKVLKDYKRMPPGGTLGGVQPSDKGVSWLSSELGKSRGYIEEKLDLLAETKEFKKAVKDRKISPTMVRAIKRTPEEFKEAVRKKVLDNEFNSRDTALEVAQALDERPDKAKELLETDYSNLNTSEAIRKVREIAPGMAEAVEQSWDESIADSKEIEAAIKTLRTLMVDKPLKTYPVMDIPTIAMHLTQLKADITDYIKDQEVNEIIEAE